MKRSILLIISILCTNCISSQSILKKEIEQIEAKLNTKKELELVELEKEINKYIQSDSIDKVYKGVDDFILKANYLPYLKNYSKKLTPELFKYYKSNESTRKVLGVLDLPKYMKDSILNFESTEIYIKAALGDSSAENELINDFNRITSKDIDNKKDERKYGEITYNILYVNSEATMKAFLNALQSDKVNEDYESDLDDELKLKYSRFNSLLGFYSRVYHYNYSTSMLYQSRFYGIHERTSEMEKYFKEIENFFFQKYDYKIIINAPFMEVGEQEIIEDQIIENPDRN